MNSRAFNVYLMSDDSQLLYYDGKTLHPYKVDGKSERCHIETVYYRNADHLDLEYVRRGLIDHDGYPEGIVVEEEFPLDDEEERSYFSGR